MKEQGRGHFHFGLASLGTGKSTSRSGYPSADDSGLTLLDIVYTALIAQRALYAAAKLGIADVLKDGQFSVDDLARATGSHRGALYRLLRGLSSVGIVDEFAGQRFALTGLGRWLRSDVPGSMRACAIFNGEPFYLQAWEEFVFSIRTGQPAWDKVHGTPFFEYLGQHPEAGRIFDDYMTSLSTREAAMVNEAYDFGRFRELVDVGGGQGRVLSAILNTHMNLRGVLFDQPHVLDGAKEPIMRAGFGDRCVAVAGNFFESVPAGSDAYMLKYIIHDWDDERSTVILKNCREAMTTDATLLIIDPIIPPPGEPHFAKLEDLEMLLLLGSQDRSVEEYAAMLDRTGFRVARVVPTTGYLTIIEARPV